MYITAAATIAHQPVFRNKGFSSGLSALKQPSDIIHPDYNAFIPVKESRRLNAILKMAIACSADCLEQAGIAQPDAIVVGTSLGCNHFTQKFLDKMLEANGGLIAPTSFMLSTHNTIAGQISLFLGNRKHNMTHTQSSLSFEQALIDGMLCIREGGKHVLAGAADETENALHNVNARLDTTGIPIASGASFFILANAPYGPPAIKLLDVGSFGLTDDLPGAITRFLDSNELTAGALDLVLYAGSAPGTVDSLEEMFPRRRLCDYQELSGVYYTNSAFALHYGVDVLQHGGNKPDRRVLVCNNLIPENLGLILIST